MIFIFCTIPTGSQLYKYIASILNVLKTSTSVKTVVFIDVSRLYFSDYLIANEKEIYLNILLDVEVSYVWYSNILIWRDSCHD